MNRAIYFLSISFCLASSATQAQWITQDITLDPGWNAVFLEVQPEPNGCREVLGDLPVESVWAWNRRVSPVQFIQDPTTLLPDQPDWLTYFPPLQPNAFRTNLFTINGGRAYLIKIAGPRSIAWRVTGQPVARPVEWIADSHNLVGFSVDPASPPSFAEFFAPSPAHSGQGVHRLSASGKWERINDPQTARMRRGEAYWVYCRGPSEYAGPLRIQAEQAGGLYFGRTLVEQVLRIRNESAGTRRVTLTPQASDSPPPASDVPTLAGAVPLSYYDTDSDGGSPQWRLVSAGLSVDLAPHQEKVLRLAVRRADMADYAPAQEGSAFSYQSLLEVADGAGVLWHLPVTANPARLEEPGASSYAGLWVGTAVIDRVSYPASTSDPTTATATGSEFQFRLVVHVDTSGTATLLQQVLMMFKPGTYKPDPQDPENLIVDEPGRYVLLTDDSLIPHFSGAAVQDGELVGRRISTAAFPLDTRTTMLGDFGTTLTSLIALGHTSHQNPFVHAYHPDHDNVDSHGDPLGPGEESFSIVRHIELGFTAEDPTGVNSPEWGTSLLGGVYRESLQGLYTRYDTVQERWVENIFVAGVFHLRHVSYIGELNDGIQ